MFHLFKVWRPEITELTQKTPPTEVLRYVAFASQNNDASSSCCTRGGPDPMWYSHGISPDRAAVVEQVVV
jgi:hypothetical protein